MSEWQPIESAPADTPDGEPPRLLVWVADGGLDGKGCVDFGWVYIGLRTGKRSPRAASHYGTGRNITHWAPIPAGPND